MSISLRHLNMSDHDQLISLADNKAIADDMCTLPSPFTKEDANQLIKRSEGDGENVLGVVDKNTEQLAGVIMLRDFESCHEQAELSIWIGEEFWGRGFGSAAIIEMSKIGFEQKKLNRIYAYCMVRNVASQRILEKSGFAREGLLRERVIICGIYEDVFIYARLKKD